MRINSVYIISCMVVLAMALIPGVAFSELKSLDDVELSKVEAEGATVNDVNNPDDVVENSGIVSVSAGEADPFDLNDPNSATNPLRLPAVNNNQIAAPQNQFYNTTPLPSCGSSRSCCP